MQQDFSYSQSAEQPPEPKKGGGGRSIILWGSIILLVLCLLAIIGGASAWNRFRNPPQAQEQDQPQQTQTQVSTAISATPGAAQSIPCGRSDQQVILLLAYDEMAEFPYGSDGVRLLRVDYANRQVDLLALPRGLWVVAPQSVQPALKAAALGEIYQYGLQNGGTNVEAARTSASQLVNQSLSENFKFSADNFIVIRLDTFSSILDNLGGVDISLPQTYVLNGQVYPAGAQHWNGATTLQFVRALPEDQSDWDRFSRQDLVLQAIRSSSLASSALASLPELLIQFKAGITTNLDTSSIASLSCLLAQTPQGQVNVESLPPDLVSPGPGIYLTPNYEAVDAFLQSWAQGN